MNSQRSKVINLYKTLLHMGKDYPLGYEFFRDRCKKAFLQNSRETDCRKIKHMIAHGNYLVKELEALYKIKKYRALKKWYYNEGHEDHNEILKKINEQTKEL